MSKRIIITLSAVLTIVALGVFTIGNALALNYYEYGIQYALSSQKPLSIQVFYKEDCKTFTKSYSQSVKQVKAKALSLQLSKEQVQEQIDSLKYYRDEVCARANDPTGLQRICSELKKTYGKHVQNIKAKGLSSQLPQTYIRKMIKEAKAAKKLACAKAKAAKQAEQEEDAGEPLPEPTPPPAQ